MSLSRNAAEHRDRDGIGMLGRGVLAALAVLAGHFAGPAVAHAQVFQVQGGGSSLFEGYGGVVNIWGNGYDASIGVGYLDGLRLGWSARRLLGGRDTLRLGNDALPFRLPTDVFGSGTAILAQGASLQRRRGRTTLLAFGGASANAVAAPYFSSNTPARGMAYLWLQRDVSRRLTVGAHAVATDRQTLLASARWTPSSGITTSVTAGMGSNAPYAAAALDARTTRLDVQAAAVHLGNGFRRASAPMPLQSETERENVRLTWRATPTLSLSVARQHFWQDSAFRGLPQRATLDQASASASLLGATVSSGWFLSGAGGVRNLSSSLGVRRDVGTRLQGEFYLLRVWAPQPSRVTTPVFLLRESVTPRLSLLQVISYEQGRASVNFGGTVSTGMSSLSLDYQVAHSPYLTANPFVQSIGLNARLQVGGYALTLGSFVTPDGRVHYSAQGSTFFYRGAPGGGALPAVSVRAHVAGYMIKGRVVTEDGAPVDGAALEIGGELVFTDSRGNFFHRRPTRQPLAIRVALEEFLSPGKYEVTSAPGEGTPEHDDRAKALTIVVRRVVEGVPRR
ncbi:MAG TPA: hypothetical protein PKC83_01645 [Gemmatimonadaceae bacterium]|nr:hypothetical protein [Gemmatimonadaceae bacterium]